MNELYYPLRVYRRRDRLINLYIFHPVGYSGSTYREYANQNRTFVNWVRKAFPKVQNEVRKLPQAYYGTVQSWIDQDVFCFYGLTKKEYMMLKLTWTFREFKLTGRKPKLNKGSISYIGERYRKPSHNCVVRFSKPGYKPKPLKLID